MQSSLPSYALCAAVSTWLLHPSVAEEVLMQKNLLLLLIGLFLALPGRGEAAEPLAPAGQSSVFLPYVQTAERHYVWITPQEIAALPASGPAWANVLAWAQQDSSQPNLGSQDDQTDAVVMAKALIYVRTGQAAYRQQVVGAVGAAIGTEEGGTALALGRNLTAYVVAADLVGLPPDLNHQFRQWLAAVRHKEFEGRSLVGTHEERPNNWGTHAGAARIAIARYLGDRADLQRAATVFYGWLGNRNAYAGFNYGSDLSWQCNPSQPVPVNPPGCMIAGQVADGILTDDQRRAGSFTWPPPQENYVWEALQGTAAQAWMLSRAGYPAFEWEQQALLRAVTWLHQQAQFPAAGDDTGTPWLINAIYGQSFPANMPAKPGKNGLGFYDWLLGS
jgi:hypothetical protein